LKIRVHNDRGPVAEELRAHLERRLDFALGGFSERFAQVTVRMSHGKPAGNGAGTGAGSGERCEIELTLRPRRMRVADSGADLFKAVENAAERLRRSITRALERERAWAEEPAPTRTPHRRK
jgi:ribosomal subunit interface protein